MTTDNQADGSTVTEQPESYSSEDLPSGAGTAAGPGGESPPSSPDAPQPAATPSEADTRAAEAESALAEERQRQAATQRELEEYRRRDENSRFESQVTTEVTRRQEQLIASKWGEAEAKQEAQSYGRAIIAERRVQEQDKQIEDAGKLVRAMQLEKETGVSAADLLPFNSPEEMERAARSRSGENKRIQALEDEISKMKTGIVPNGTITDSNSGTGGMSDKDLIAAYANGSDVDVKKVQAALARL